jgi:hypothetical protein
MVMELIGSSHVEVPGMNLRIRPPESLVDPFGSGRVKTLTLMFRFGSLTIVTMPAYLVWPFRPGSM